MEILFILFAFIAVLSIVIAVPMIAGIVPPNPIYGFRVPSTMKDPSLWYPVNRHFAWWMLASGVLLLVATVLFYFFPGINKDFYAIACMMAAILPLIIGISSSFRLLAALRKAKDSTPDQVPEI
jgi:drug/metabolite transporter (DMT)-like permease